MSKSIRRMASVLDTPSAVPETNPDLRHLPASTCDVVMKGGITSGVVYPLAVVELAKKYRLRNIGGTSAGALAAAIAAAAEYGRSTGGYEKIAAIPEEIAPRLFSLFQPTRELRPLFELLKALITTKSSGARSIRIVLALCRYIPSTLVSLVLALVVMGCISYRTGSLGWLLFGLLLGIAAAGWVAAGRIRSLLAKELVDNNFGICRGHRHEATAPEELADWLTDKIDHVAGLDLSARDGKPLTFGDLWGRDRDDPDVNLITITTNLSMRRPYELPLDTRIYLFRKSEFALLFPERVVRHMLQATKPYDGDPDDDLFYLPPPEEFPVIVAARMSLSFPLLISAVPLWTRDFTFRTDQDRRVPRKCLFSDGGLSSNFPVELFDAMLPNSPTFAISLDRYDERRNGDDRIWMAKAPGDGILIPLREITSLGGFAMSLFDAAKDWQNNLQASLPGYRDRVVRIALADDEGGLNLDMDPKIIKQLAEYGGQAGALAAGPAFDFDDHRWRRFLVAMNAFEALLADTKRAYDGRPAGPEPFSEFLKRYFGHAKTYAENNDERQTKVLRERIEEVIELASRWAYGPHIRDGKIPKPAADFKLRPDM